MSVVKPKPIPLRVLPVYPTLGSLTDVINYAESCLPIMDANLLTVVLMTYHNTLLKELEKTHD